MSPTPAPTPAPASLERLLPRCTLTIPPDSRRVLEFELDARGGTPERFFVPEGYRKGIRIVNISVCNRGGMVPFFSGRDFYAELFDGKLLDDEPRDKPYGVLPRVPADPGSVVEVIVWNTTLEELSFTAELLVKC